MKKRLPDTTIYLDTSDFLITSDPNQTDIQVSERVIVKENRDGTSKEQTITGKLNLSNGLSVTNGVTVTGNSIFNNNVTVSNGGVTVTGNSIFNNNVIVGTNKISQYDLQSSKIITDDIESYSQDHEYKSSTIKLSSFDTYQPSSSGTIVFEVFYQDNGSNKYTLSKEGFYADPGYNTNIDINLGTRNFPWSTLFSNKIFSGSISSNYLEGTLTSLYNVVVPIDEDPDRITPNYVERGALFLAQTWFKFYPDRTYNTQGCVTISLLYMSKGNLPNTYEQYWSQYFGDIGIVFRHGVITTSNDTELLPRIEIWRSGSQTKSDNYKVYYDSSERRYKVEVDIGEGDLVKLWFAITNINSSPLLYNGRVLSSKQEVGVVYPNYPRIGDISQVASLTGGKDTFKEAIDFSKWLEIAFLGDVGFKLGSSIYQYNGGVGQYGASSGDWGFGFNKVGSIDGDCIDNNSVSVSGYTLAVMKVD